MKFKAKLMEAQTKTDCAGDVYTRLVLRLYQVPEQGQPDPEAQNHAAALAALPYIHKGMVNVTIEIPEDKKK
jgi:hypothetical protein